MSNNATPIITDTSYEKPKDIFGAISHLEILYEAELSGADIPEKIATVKERLDFFNLGFRSIVKGTLISIILAPFFAAVLGERIPIFGNFNPNMFDKILAYVLSFGYSIAMIMLFGYTATLKSGRISAIISNNILIGMTVGLITQFVIAEFIYGLLNFVLLTDVNLQSFFMGMYKLGLPTNFVNALNIIITAIKTSLTTAMYIFFYTSITLVILPWVIGFIRKFINKTEDI